GYVECMEHRPGSHCRMTLSNDFYHFDSPCFNERLMYLPFLLAKVILSFDFSHTIKHFHLHACFLPVVAEPVQDLDSNFFLMSVSVISEPKSITFFKYSTSTCFCPTSRSSSDTFFNRISVLACSDSFCTTTFSCCPA